jgi:hypothetical protein
VSNDAPTIPAEQKSASKNSLAGNRLQKCKHPGGKVPFFHELKSSQKTLPAWVYFHALSFSYLLKITSKNSCRPLLIAVIFGKTPLFPLTKRKFFPL